MLGPFIFGGNTGETPQSVARQRAYAAQLMYGQQRQARNVGEGWGNAIASLGQGLAARAYHNQADAAEAEGQKRGNALQEQFYRALTGGAPPPASGGASPATAPASSPPMAPVTSEGALPGLMESRKAFAEELKDPAIAAQFAGLIQAEVGGQGPQAQQALGESVLNRAHARGQTLQTAMGGNYWPSITHQRVAQYAQDPQYAQKYQKIMEMILGGSNVSQFATGNASGTVGFNGGPQVSAFGGERFGVEGPDRAWADRMRGQGTQVASLDPSAGLPTGADPLPPRPGAPPSQAAQPMPQPPQQVAQAAPPPQQPPAQQRPDLSMLMQTATNPWVPEETRTLASSMLQQEMQRQQQAQDPGYQMQQEQARTNLELSRERLNQLRNPQPRATEVEANAAARDRVARQMGLEPGSPAYQSYVLTGKMPREDQQPLTATDKKAILEADELTAANRSAITNLDTASTVSPQANSGLGASWRAWAGNALPDLMVPDFISSPESSAATAQLENITTGNALESLKATFGGNPTEGERKILLDIQGAAGQPDHVRQEIYARARAAAERRLKFNEDRAAQLRGGTYYKPQDGSAVPPAPQAAGVPTAGTVQQGYRFKGGNPADPSSWEKVN